MRSVIPASPHTPCHRHFSVDSPLGVGAQWLARRLTVPSILLLLVAGLFIGPVVGTVDPDHLFGELLFPIVSLAVAVILF